MKTAAELRKMAAALKDYRTHTVDLLTELTLQVADIRERIEARGKEQQG